MCELKKLSIVKMTVLPKVVIKLMQSQFKKSQQDHYGS